MAFRKPSNTCDITLTSSYLTFSGSTGAAPCRMLSQGLLRVLHGPRVAGGVLRDEDGSAPAFQGHRKKARQVIAAEPVLVTAAPVAHAVRQAALRIVRIQHAPRNGNRKVVALGRRITRNVFHLQSARVQVKVYLFGGLGVKAVVAQ